MFYKKKAVFKLKELKRRKEEKTNHIFLLGLKLGRLQYNAKSTTEWFVYLYFFTIFSIIIDDNIINIISIAFYNYL